MKLLFDENLSHSSRSHAPAWERRAGAWRPVGVGGIAARALGVGWGWLWGAVV